MSLTTGKTISSKKSNRGVMKAKSENEKVVKPKIHKELLEMPLDQKDIKYMCKVVREAFDPSPAIKAAKELRAKGFTSLDFWMFQRNESLEVRCLDASWVTSVFNELRDMEILEK